MVRAKGNFTYWLFVGVTIFLIALFISGLSQHLIGIQLIKISINSDREFVLQTVLVLLALTMTAPVVWHNSKQIIVDTIGKTISIKSLIGRQQIFHFEDFDGMFRSSIRRGKMNTSYELIYLRRQGKVIAYVDEFFCSNIEAFRLSLKYMHNLGFQRMTLFKRIKVVLGRPISLS